MGTVFSSLSKFFRSTAGNTSILFTLASVPLLLAAGVAVDFLRYTNARTEVQSALDAAALAAALPLNKTNDERKQIARDYFQSNVTDRFELMENFVVKVNADTVEVRLEAHLETAFMGLAGYDRMIIKETSEVMRPFEGSAEVALVLDYSGSMNKKGKYQAMAAAANTMITNLDAAVEDGKLKVGLVPFSAMVYTEMHRNYVTRTSATPIWVGCTQDRGYPYNTTVDTPTNRDETKWGYVDSNGENNGTRGCSAYDNKKLKVVPLTADLARVKSALAAMQPLGNTNIPLGAEFGWNLLDPQLPFDEGQPYTNTSNRKFLVLLTDGVQTSRQFGEGGGRSVQNGNQNLVELCKNMRDAGVIVFTIAYDITDPAVTDLLKACAPGRYYEPDTDGNEINQVFNQVTRQIRNQTARLKK